MPANLKHLHSVLRIDELLAILFLLVAACISWAYGYPLRYYILTDIIYHYLLLFPIFLVFLFYFHIESPYLRLAWTILALGLTIPLILIILSAEFHGYSQLSTVTWILRISIFLWCWALFVHLLKKPRSSAPPSKDLEKTLFLPILAFLRGWWPIFAILFAYCTLKSIIPVVNPRLYDEQFYMLDYFLFLKHDPTELALRWVPASSIGLLSFGYTFYFLLKMLAFSSLYCAVKDRRVFHRMVLAFSLTLIIGMGIYFLLPAQGPVYYYPKKFERIQEPISETRTYRIQRNLWTVYEQVKQHTPEDFTELTRKSGIQNGVAAFPSLHIAVSCVLLYFLYMYHRVTFWLCFFPFWLMALATIYFGWHYVVDNVTGFVLACFVLAIVNHGFNDSAY